MPSLSGFLSDEKGAVAATYAIAVTGLIIVAGAAFDYNRIMTLDSELQTAADQAALAGATQLDKQDGACARAGNAAVELLQNITLLSNDGSGNSITVNSGATVGVSNDACASFTGITFFEDTAKTIVATTDEDARYIEVDVDDRAARYAFTSIGSLASSDASGRAMAGVGSAICRVPPLKICNPAEPTGNTDVFLDFDVESNLGAGITLLGNETDVPGAFGFLQTEFGSGANGLLAALGWDVRGGDCVSVDGVEIQNGVVNSARDGINVRFDAPGNGQYCPDIGGISGTCSPSVNVRKDLVRQANNDNWGPYLSTQAATAHLFAYRPVTSATYDSTFGAGVTPQIMGHPRDMCHAWSHTGNCTTFTGYNTGLVGTGDWDINAYWRSSYGSNYVAGTVPLTSYGVTAPGSFPTRYQVYRWEAEQIAAGTLPGGVSQPAGANQFAYAQPQSGRAAATASSPFGLIPGSDLDRRRMSVAVLNCGALQNKYGNSLNNRVLEVSTWIDIFLVEPARARQRCQGGGPNTTINVGGVDYTISCNDKFSEQFEVYVELIGRTDIGGDNGTNLQTVRRDLPHLIE